MRLVWIGLGLAGFCLPTIATEFEVGPWRPGMSREEVLSFREHGPYEPVAITGGLETKSASLNGQVKNVSFVFDDSGVVYIQVWEYEGKDTALAQKAVFRVFDRFVEGFGGAEISGIEVSGSASLDRSALDAVLQQTLGTAIELGRKQAREHAAVMSFVFEMHPRLQPVSSQIWAQFGYHAQFETFYVMLYQGRKDLSLRTAVSKMHMEVIK